MIFQSEHFVLTFLQLHVFISAFYIAFINGTCDPDSNPCVFTSPIESMLGMFAMNVGEFEDIYGTFDYSEYPTFMKVSQIWNTEVPYGLGNGDIS